MVIKHDGQISPISSHLEPIKEVLSRDKIPNAKEWKNIRMFNCKVCIIHLIFCSQTSLIINTNLPTINIYEGRGPFIQIRAKLKRFAYLLFDKNLI